MRRISTIAPDWWDYTTLDAELLDDAARLAADDLPRLSRAGFSIRVYDTAEDFYLAEALEYIDAWRQATPERPAGICGPIGPTEQLPLVARLVNALEIDLRQAHFWGMDEWAIEGREVGLDYPLGFAKADLDLCFDRIEPHLQMPSENLHFPTAEADAYRRSFDQVRCVTMQGGQGENQALGLQRSTSAASALAGRAAPARRIPQARHATGRVASRHDDSKRADQRRRGGGRNSVASDHRRPDETWKAEKVSIWHPGHHDNPFGLAADDVDDRQASARYVGPHFAPGRPSEACSSIFCEAASAHAKSRCISRDVSTQFCATYPPSHPCRLWTIDSLPFTLRHTMPSAKRAFAIAAHPDDIEFVMAGTLILLRNAGYEIHCLNIANGCCGSSEWNAERTAAIRARKPRTRRRIRSAPHWHPSLVNDLEIFYDDTTLKRLAAIVREVAPEILLTHAPVDYMADHENACRLAVTAAFARSMPNYPTIPPRAAVSEPVTIYHAQPHGNREPLATAAVRPHIFVNIADVMHEKRQMLSRHRSQARWLDETQGMDSYVRSMESLMGEVGRMSGRFALAEGWRRRLHLGFCGPDADPLSRRWGPMLGPTARQAAWNNRSGRRVKPARREKRRGRRLASEPADKPDSTRHTSPKRQRGNPLGTPRRSDSLASASG